MDIARLGNPSLSFLDTCVRMWHLGDFYKIQTLTETAQIQMWQRVSRYIHESSHVAIMADRVPFIPDLESGIRAAWEPEKAAGRPRLYLLALTFSVSAYLKCCPSFMSLLDEVPGFTMEFIKLLIGSGEAAKFIPVRRSPRVCMVCRKEIYMTDLRLGLCQVVYFTTGVIVVMNGDTEVWFCSKACFEKTKFYCRHLGCSICEKEKPEGQEIVAVQRG